MSRNEHPLATAIVEGAKALNLSLKEASDFVQQLATFPGPVTANQSVSAISR
ncbi:MAG: hypothetical protein ACLR2C_08760 [Parasutterella excrementihominis]